MTNLLEKLPISLSDIVLLNHFIDSGIVTLDTEKDSPLTISGSNVENPALIALRDPTEKDLFIEFLANIPFLKTNPSKKPPLEIQGFELLGTNSYCEE